MLCWRFGDFGCSSAMWKKFWLGCFWSGFGWIGGLSLKCGVDREE